MKIWAEIDKFRQGKEPKCYKEKKKGVYLLIQLQNVDT